MTEPQDLGVMLKLAVESGHRDPAAERAYILAWNNIHKNDDPPLGWYESWKIYLNQLRTVAPVTSLGFKRRCDGTFCRTKEGNMNYSDKLKKEANDLLTPLVRNLHAKHEGGDDATRVLYCLWEQLTEVLLTTTMCAGTGHRLKIEMLSRLPALAQEAENAAEIILRAEDDKSKDDPVA